MATDSDFDSCEFDKIMRHFPSENGLAHFSSEDSSICEGNKKHISSSEKNNYNYDLASTSSKSGSEIRYINPMIYPETFETDDNCGDHLGRSRKHQFCHSSRLESKHGANTLTDGISLLSISNGEDLHIYGDHTPGTYRYFPSITSSTNSSTDQQSRTVKQIERRCKITSDLSSSLESKSFDDLPLSGRYKMKNEQRCSLNGFGNSTTSFSTTNLSGRQTPNGIPSSRQMAHEKWMQEKEERIFKLKEEKRQAEKMRQEEEEKIKSEKEEKERREHETFIRWIERKKHEEAVKQQVLRRELELQKRLKDIEDKAVVAKTIYLRQWARKKEENHKEQQKKQQLKEQQKGEEKKKRIEESNKAYGEWRQKSKIKPKPATQGLLPHQKAKPAFVNPNPWQDIIEIDETNKELMESKQKELIKSQKTESKKKAKSS